MEDKLQHFFNENEFDILEPRSGHINRFERRLQGAKPQKKISWRWMSVAAVVILCIGFGLGNMMQSDATYDLGNISPKMAEAQDFFVNAILVETMELEKSRNLETEKIVESALEQLEELEDSYKAFQKELQTTGEQRKIINAMISNYQQRLEILQNALYQIDNLNKNKYLEDETYI